MTKKEFIESIAYTYAKGIELIKRKNADYATGENPFRNFEYADLAGVSVERAIMVRVMDKMARVSNLLDKNPEVIDEKLEDTLLDVINYLAILKAYLERNNVNYKKTKKDKNIKAHKG